MSYLEEEIYEEEEEKEEPELSKKKLILMTIGASAFIFIILYLTLELFVPALNTAPPAVRILKIVIPGIPALGALIGGMAWAIKKGR